MHSELKQHFKEKEKKELKIIEEHEGKKDLQESSQDEEVLLISRSSLREEECKFLHKMRK